LTTLYQLENCYDRRALETPDGRRKAQLFAALIPSGCRTILDAGGGTGWSTIGMREDRRVVTLDSSAESLAHASGETMLAGVDALPYPDRSFDMVISSQVLEHLPDDILAKSTSEMMRVAKDYLLVSTPYREARETRFVRCANCGHAFHPDYHCRSFREQDIAALFPGWIMAEWHVFGAISRGVGVRRLRPAKAAKPSQQPPARDGTICPRCETLGNDTTISHSIGAPSVLERAVSSAKSRLRRLLGIREPDRYATFLPQGVAPYWIAALFIREGASPVDGDLRPEWTSG
jgi:SAM-dependent methyltransferase